MVGVYRLAHPPHRVHRLQPLEEVTVMQDHFHRHMVTRPRFKGQYDLTGDGHQT